MILATMMEKIHSNSLSGDINNNEEVHVQEGDAEQIPDDSSRTVRTDVHEANILAIDSKEHNERMAKPY